MKHQMCRLVVLSALIAAGCSSPASEPIVAPVEVTIPSTTSTSPPASLPDYAAAAGAFEDAVADNALPPVAPVSPTGSYGFSRYVYKGVDGEVLPTLIEGPRGQQVRCQQVERECSFGELRELFESGAELPGYLGMDRETLGELVGQLDLVRDAVDEFPTIEEACAAGFRVTSAQSPNMGVHASNPFAAGGFDPARPQMVLYASEAGALLTVDEQGTCVEGEWTGASGYTSVGAVFNLALTPEHPEAFAGPLDNFHVHFNTCAGSSDRMGVLDRPPEVDTQGATATFDRAACQAEGGTFFDVVPTWMIHAYVDPDHEAQGGVFAMFNPSIWPIVEDPTRIAEGSTEPIGDGFHASIDNFDFGTIDVEVGERVVFSNSDGVPHTVTAGTPTSPTGAFDSGLFGTGESYTQTFASAGAYQIFCVLHPQMTGAVSVSE